MASVSKLIISIALMLLLFGAVPHIPLQTKAQTYQKYRLIVIFRDDDVQPYFRVESLKRVNEVFENVSVPVTLGIVPNAQGKVRIDSDKNLTVYLQEILAKDRLFEAALHGLTHENTTWLGAELGWSEFAKLPLERQQESVRQGLAILHSAFPSVSITTFIPPFNTYDDNTTIALRDKGLTTVCSDDYFERVLYGRLYGIAPLDPNLPPTPMPADLPTSQPFVLNGTLHLQCNMETYNFTSNNWIPQQRLQDRFEEFYARPGSTFMMLLHYWRFTSEEHFQYLKSLIEFIKTHDGVAFMTAGQFSKSFLSGVLRKTETGWELPSTHEVNQTTIETTSVQTSSSQISIIQVSYLDSGYIRLIASVIIGIAIVISIFSKSNGPRVSKRQDGGSASEP